MSLTTTMGIELSYVPQAIQMAYNRGATFDAQDALGERNLTHGLCQLLSHMVKIKRIPTYGGVHTDPGCVEVATKPYSKISTLLRIARRIGREANALGLTPCAEYTGGGGAHIHTGIPYQERDKYIRRMFLFCGMNPWLSWACVNVVDDINAQPITSSQLLGVDEFGETNDAMADCKYEVEVAERKLIGLTRDLHHADCADPGYYQRRIERALHSLMQTRKDLHRYKKRVQRMQKKRAAVYDVQYNWDKDTMLRLTSYGRNGTIEFRMFEMGDEAKLKRNLILANAICSYVERWDIEHFSTSSVFTTEQLLNTTARKARNGWLKMLRTLGLDPAEYADETANIAARWEHYKVHGGNPAGVPIPEYVKAQSREQERTQAVVARAVARHHRKLDKRAARAARAPCP